MKNLWNLYTDYLGRTIFHPQYIMNTYTFDAVLEAKARARGKLIDIGCGRMPYRDLLETRVAQYYAVDEPQVSKLYKNKYTPDLYADAHNLPLPNRSFDICLLLEVLEYFHSPSLALSEVSRILKKNGTLIVSSPFMYPIHDGKYDRNRFTKTQIQNLLENTGFRLIKIKNQGNFFEFWMQSLLVYLFKLIQKLMKRNILFKVISVLLLPPMLILVLLINCLCIIIGLFSNSNNETDFPLNILTVAKKK